MARDTTDKTRTMTGAQSQHLAEQIRQRAYELYEARGREDGHELDDWLRAQEEITQRKTRSIAA